MGARRAGMVSPSAVRSASSPSSNTPATRRYGHDTATHCASAEGGQDSCAPSVLATRRTREALTLRIRSRAAVVPQRSIAEGVSKMAQTPSSDTALMLQATPPRLALARSSKACSVARSTTRDAQRAAAERRQRHVRYVWHWCRCPPRPPPPTVQYLVTLVPQRERQDRVHRSDMLLGEPSSYADAARDRSAAVALTITPKRADRRRPPALTETIRNHPTVARALVLINKGILKLLPGFDLTRSCGTRRVADAGRRLALKVMPRRARLTLRTEQAGQGSLGDAWFNLATDRTTSPAERGLPPSPTAVIATYTSASTCSA